MKLRTSNRRAALVFAALLAPLLCAWPAPMPEAGAQTRTAAGGARTRPARGSISGRVVGEGGEPLEGVAVQVRPRGAAPNSGWGASLTTDAEGNFVARGLEPGPYNVWAGLPGYVADPELANDRGHRPGDFVTVRLIRGGVITGSVTDAGGVPLVGLMVTAHRVRDQEGRPAAAPSAPGITSQTDDRGVYRVYGLPAGTYLVGVRGWGPYSPFEGDVPTYYPSATRDTAAEVTVRPGQEVVGIDIRYREERGRRVSGTLMLPAQMPSEGGVNVSLSYAGSSALAGGVWLGPHEAQAFSIEGVPDGEFELQAHVQTREGAPASSEPLRVVVRGADVTGLRLTLAPMASVGGTVIVEPLPEALRALPACKERAALMPTQEALVVARRDAGGRARPAGRGPQQPEAVPDEAGAFTLRNLEPGAYRVEARPLDENFYTRLVQLPAPRTAARPGAAAAPSAVLRVASGQQLTGLSIRVVAGAAGVSGRVVPAEGAAPFPPAALRLHLVPAERERAEETIHYAETTPSADGSFAFRNLAPGRYLFLARPLDAGEYPPRPAAWDADARARLRREAEAAGLTLDLQPCQRVTDFALRHPHTPGK